MVSNLMLQDTLDGIREITEADISILELDGKTVASTAGTTDTETIDIGDFIRSNRDSENIGTRWYFKIYDDVQPAYVLVVDSDDENAKLIGEMAAFQIKNLLITYKEHFDQDNFIKNLLLDNLLIVDIYSRAKKLNIEPLAKRVVYILEADKEQDYIPVDNIKEMYTSSGEDYITAVDEKSVIIVKELKDNYSRRDLEKAAKEILHVADKSNRGFVKIAFGNVVNEIKEVSRSYKEARMALDVGKIFFEEKNIIAYSQLGIGRIIYQLPVPLCKMFIKEIFGDKSVDDFDEATVVTINKFFENSLNVSETSRQLFIHRNTLVYRLDKILKSTGLDLRVFDDAITFKIALMVVRYMKYMEKQEY